MSTNNTGTTSIVARTLPDYTEHMMLWEFFKLSYNGGPKYIRTQLFKYFKEGEQEFEQRKSRAYYENYCKTIVDIVNSYLFKEDAIRRTSNDKLESFYKNVDGNGKSITQFMKNVSVKSSVMGRVYICADKKPLDQSEMTGTHIDNLKSAPYLYIIEPQDVVDIAFDEIGNVKWAIVIERKRDDDDPFTSSGDIKTYYRLWEKGKWTLFDESENVVDSGKTGLNSVPIIPVDTGEKIDAYNSVGIIFDLAFINRSIFNNYSRLDTVIADQTFSQLIFPIEGLPLGELLENDTLREKFLTLATNRILFFSAQAEAKPEFIAPDASQANFILSTIKHQIKQLFSSIGLKDNSSEGVTPASGTSKAFDFDQLNKMLAGKADNLEYAERKIVELFGDWINIPVEAEIDYPDDFDIRSLADEIILTQELSLLDISETFTKEVQKNLALKALPRADKATMDTILKEIREKSFDMIEEDENFDFDGDTGDTRNKSIQSKNKSEQMTQTKYKMEKLLKT